MIVKCEACKLYLGEILPLDITRIIHTVCQVCQARLFASDSEANQTPLDEEVQP